MGKKLKFVEKFIVMCSFKIDVRQVALSSDIVGAKIIEIT